MTNARAAIFILLLCPASAGAEPAPARSTAKSACTSSEKWEYSDQIASEWRKELAASLAGRASPARGFSQALALRSRSAGGEARALGEYWIARSFHASGLVHVAHRGFSAMVAAESEAAAIGPRLAALECLNRISEKYPTLFPPEEIEPRLAELVEGATHGLKEVVWEAAIRRVLVRLAEPGGEKHARKLLDRLQGSGNFDRFARGLIAASAEEPRETVRQLGAFLDAQPSETGMTRLAPFRAQATLLAARALYRLKRYDEASARLRSIPKSSNELAKALSELAWSRLLAEDYGEAVGAALGLQSGGLRHTFAPEAPMVTAMALNELCQFPQAIRSIEHFRKQYKESYEWLKAAPREGKAPYPLAVAFLREKQTKTRAEVPGPVASEWVRSPLFIGRQYEINLLIEERSRGEKIRADGATEQERWAVALLAEARALLEAYRLARTKLGPGDSIPSILLDRLAAFRRDLVNYQRFRRAAPLWEALVSRDASRAPAARERLITAINTDLARLSLRMLAELDDVAENSQLIEIEIYNGASQDIIWRNAHPDYLEIARNMDSSAPGRDPAAVWNWGKVSDGLDGPSEVWEDELGSFKADVFDNCSSKDKYLAVKREAVLNALR